MKNWKFCVAIMVAVLVLSPDVYAQDESDSLKMEASKLVVEPKFQGGAPDTFSKWVKENISYADNPGLRYISGVIKVRFTVSKDGYLKDIETIVKADPLLDFEVIRVIKQSPKWELGLNQHGEPVDVMYTMPIKFRAAKPKKELNPDKGLNPRNQLYKNR